MAEFQKPICGCFDDFTTCIITYFVPCYTAGKNAEAMGENCLLCGFLAVLPPVGIFTRGTIRKKIREKYGIQGSFVNDLLCSCCCGICALVQEAQEIKAHGDGTPSGMSMARE